MPDITVSYKGSDIATLSASGTKTLLTEGKYCEDDITISYTQPSTPAPTLQAKSNIDPTTSSQTITPDYGYDGLSSVQINAMPSGSATTPATTITANPSISVNNSTGKITATVSKTQSVTPSVSAGYISSGTAGTITVSGTKSSTMTTVSATTYTPSTSAQIISAGRFLIGAQTIKGDANLLAENIKKDVSIFGVTGTYEGGGGGGGGTEYVISASQHPVLNLSGFDLSSAGLTASDVAIDGNTLVWVEATSSFTMYCWLDSDDDDDFAVTIPSGTKFTCAVSTDSAYDVSATFVGKTSSTYGFFNMSADKSDDFFIHQSYGDNPNEGGFVRSLSYKAQNGVPTFASHNFPLALHIVKFS